MEEELKSIKVELNYYDDEGKSSIKPMTIKVNKVKDSSEHGIGWTKKSYEMSFSLVLPNHIHELLKGKSVPKRGMGTRNETKTYSDFPKTITAETVRAVCEKYWEITQDFLWLLNVQKTELKKVIFYKFDTESRDYVNEWDGKHYGKKNNLNYRYAIGYISENRGEVLRYNHNKELVNYGRDTSFYSNQYVEWSEEREIFFNNIQNSFVSIIEKINSFNDSITEETINHFLSTNNLKLLS
jgi:hypothetical protein